MKAAVLALALLGVPSIAQPDALSQLGSTLERLPGRDPVRARIELTLEVTADSDAPPLVGELWARVENVNGELRILYADELLRRIAAEEREIENPDRRPLTDAIGAIHPMGVAEALNFAPRLRELLRDATREQAATPRQASEQTLVVRNDPHEKSFMVSEHKRTIEITLGADGVPSVVEVKIRKKGGIPLLRVYNTENVTRDLQQLGDRLIVTRTKRVVGVEGFGMSFQRSTELLVHVEP